MLADRMKKRETGFMLIILTIMCIGSGGCGNSSPKDPLQDPTAITTSSGEVIHYGGTRESVEEILGMEPTFWGYDEHYVQYTDETAAFYRETDGEDCLAYIQIADSSYITYQGVRVGDQWEEVREKLNLDLVREELYTVDILFDNGKQIDANIDRDKWEEDWLIIGYTYNIEGTITGIWVLDEKAAEFE